MRFLHRLLVDLAPSAAVAATVITRVVFRRPNKSLRLASEIPAKAGQVSQLNTYVYELYSPRVEASMEVLFFHGFQQGDYKDAHLSTWKCRDGSSIWPQTWLAEKFHDARILSVSYNAGVIKSCQGGSIDMHLISENLTSDLLSAKVGQNPCRPVVLVGHSFGGLVIKQICVYASSTAGSLRDCEKKFQLTTFLENVRGIFFYSTPHQGVKEHIAEHFVAKGPLLEYVKTLSTQLARDNFNFDKLCGQEGKYKMWQIEGLGESLQTRSGSFSDVVVEEASARYGTSFNVVERADHISVCRPMEKTCRSFSTLANFLEGVAVHSKATVYGLTDYPTALETRVYEVQQKLANTPVLGIVGMGGIGKTTIAKALFNKISGQYEYTCFVDNAKGMTARELTDWVMNHFLRNGTRVKQNSLQWSHLERKKSLITMDDVDSKSQVRILPGLDKLGSGSRVIFTTRDRGVLNTLLNCGIYEVDFLKPDEAKKLFCQHVFEQEGIPDDLTKVNCELEDNVKNVVEKCAGLPLTLEIMGCYLRDHRTNARFWKEALGKLGKAESVDGRRDDGVWSSLRMSYDNLSPEEQGMFVEAGTYFFEEPVETALAAWSAAFGYSESRWANLLRTSMVKEVDKTEWDHTWSRERKYKEVWVHEHLRDLANRLSQGAMVSRCVGKSYGAVDPLRANEVQAQTSMLRLWYGGEQPFLDYPQATLQLELLDTSEKVKYVELHDILPEGSSSTLSRKLCLLRCRLGSSQKHCRLPLNLEDMDNLVVLDLERWHMAEGSLEALEKLINLRILVLGYIWGPSRLPDNFGHLHLLKRLELTRVGLTALPHSFGNLSALQDLSLSDLKLQDLPESFGNLSSISLHIGHCGTLAGLPKSFGNLSSLGTLEISECARLASLPESFGNLSSLVTLDIGYCGSLAGLPESFENLASLVTLHIGFCLRLAGLPESFGNLSSLVRLQIRSCSRRLPESFGSLLSLRTLEISGLASLPESFGNLSSLAILQIRDCRDFASLPNSFGHLSSLTKLDIVGCPSLRCQHPTGLGTHGLQENLSSLRYLNLVHCDSLERLPASFELLSALEELVLERCEGLKTLPDRIGQFKSLKRLIIRGAKHLETLPDSFGNLPALTYLRLGDCKSLERLPASFGNLSALQELIVVSCDVLQRLPDNFGQLSALKSFTVQADHLEELPDSFGNLSSLEYLWMRADRLQRVPVSIGQLQALKDMTVRAEMLRSLPEELGNLCSLNMLEIDSCGYLEALPDRSGHMSALGVVKLHSCSSLKSLPDSLGKNFWPHGDRSTESRRPVAEHSCLRASREGFRLHIWRCPRLDDLVLQRLGWIQDDSCKELDDLRVLGGRWYRRKCHGE